MFLPYLSPFAVVVQLLSHVQLLWLHAKLPCSILSPGVCSNPCPLSRWCHPTISSSIVPFSSCLQSFPASGSFPMSQFFTSGGQRIGVSASASVLPMNMQGWFPLGLPGLSSLQSKESQEFYSGSQFESADSSALSLLYGSVCESRSVMSDSLQPQTIQSMEFSRPGVGCLSFPSTADFPNPGIKPRSPALQVVLYQLNHEGSPRILEWVAYPFSSWPRKWTGVFCIARGFFTNWAMREAQLSAYYFN